PEEAARFAAIDASVSHDRDGIWAAQAIAASTAAALSGETVEEVVAAGRRFIPEDSWLGRRMAAAAAILDEFSDEYDRLHALHTRLWTPSHSISPEAIPQVYALYIMSGGDFRKGFLLSANFGRDADTVCALVLALCAAGRGMSVIPESWVEKVRRPAGVCLRFAANYDLVDLAKELADAALESGNK
ncbi:MAG: ADP-ribosylglycohydrolase family protein, partial [Spirochaetaceae bacterium]|nr:ADP-ribosylglycohydrolase family protein [Spirochaetaceae bacterium]